MGLGTKIKEVLTGEKDHQTTHTSQTTPSKTATHASPTTHSSKTPGAYPEEVPRTIPYESEDGLSNTNKPLPDTKAGGLAGTKDSNYSHTGANSKVGQHDTLGHHDKTGLTSGHKESDLSPTTGTHSGKLSKDNKHPYWGSTGKEAGNEFGTGSNSSEFGTGSKANERHATFQPEQTAGIYNGVAGKGSEEYPSTHSTTGGQEYRSMLDPTPATSTNQHGHNGSSTGGVTSNLAHRPHGSGTATRDQKLNEYDAPTSSGDRHHGGLAAAGTGAAAGLGASQLSQRHHEQDLQDYQGAGRGQGTTGHGSNGYGMTGASHGRGNSDLNEYDDYSKSHGVPAGGRGDHTNAYGIGAGALDHSDRTHGSGMQRQEHGLLNSKPGVHDPYSTRQSGDQYNQHSSPVGAFGTHDSHNTRHTQQHSPTAAAFGAHDSHSRGSPRNSGFGAQSGLDREHGSVTSGSDQGNGSAGAVRAGGPDHYGPGHAGAKVLHRCDHCGTDNDISKYFRKEVIYRMS